MVTLQRHGDGVPPDHLDGAILIDAESAWVAQGTPQEVGLVEAALGREVCTPIAAGVLLVRFGNCVGQVEDAGPLGRLVIRSGKWHERDFDTLLQDLSRVTAALPFAASTSSALPYERTVVGAQDAAYHAFVWLRHALLREEDSELHDAIEGILRSPHRRLVRTTREVPVELAGHLGTRSLDDVASGRWPLVSSRMGFMAGGRQVLPVRIDETLARESVDTAENRFVKAFLEECAGVVDLVRQRLGRGDGAAAHRVKSDCARLIEVIRTWRRSPIWREVGLLTHFPESSTVLQRRSEYRSVLRHHQMIRLGSRVPIDPTVSRRLLDSKDVAALYELWSAFVVLDEVGAILGRPSHVARVVTDSWSATVRWGLIARWSDGTELAYNGTYTRTTGFHGKSRSLRLRPDVALNVATGPNAGLHLFDAKFRLDGTLDPDLEDDDTTYKHSDLWKMHAYRDAIPAARTAWVVYPGAEDAVFFDDGRRGLSTLMDGPLDGVGALSLRPDSGRGALRCVLRHALLKPVAVAREVPSDA